MRAQFSMQEGAKQYTRTLYIQKGEFAEEFAF